MLGRSQKPVYFRWKTHQLALSRLFQSSNLWDNFTIKRRLMLSLLTPQSSHAQWTNTAGGTPHPLEIWGWLRVNGLKFTLVCTWHCAWKGCTFSFFLFFAVLKQSSLATNQLSTKQDWGKVGWPVSSFFQTRLFFWYVFKHLKVLSYITYLGDRLECTVCWFAGKHWAS